jgi:2,3-bisphosphoglycerate-independent phosphoglycerate mutase
MRNNKVIFVFLDGVGVGPENPDNPFAVCHMKFLWGLTGCTLTSRRSVTKRNVVFKGIDACLGVPGAPQSATGQTALFTGVNAPKLLGYHYPAFPNEELGRIIETDNIFLASSRKGIASTFANAYSVEYFRLVREGKRKHSVTTLSVISAGLPFRKYSDLVEGRAVCWDITNDYLRERFGADIDSAEPETAGKNLAGLLDENDLVVFECFLPDLIGHERSMEKAGAFCLLLDRFCSGVIENMHADATLVISSDHGNVEDLSTGGHTLNPAILIAIGAHAASFAGVEAITEIKDRMLGVLAG